MQYHSAGVSSQDNNDVILPRRIHIAVRSVCTAKRSYCALLVFLITCYANRCFILGLTEIAGLDNEGLDIDGLDNDGPDNAVRATLAKARMSAGYQWND